MTNDTIITVADARHAGYCVAGIRAWFVMKRIDFRDFVKNGITVGRLLEIDDEFSRKVIAVKQEREG